jgi:hypothetical protein
MLQNPPVVPVRCVVGANLEETAVKGLYGCWRELYLWVWQAYDLDYTWDRAGLDDACNVAKPFGKVVNAAFLINYALSDDITRQWHSTQDYRDSSRAQASSYHASLYYRLSLKSGSAEANAETGRFLAQDRINLLCRLFDLGNPSDSASIRAADMVHESWHHWQYHHGFTTKHPQCGSPSRDCDYYYPHRVSGFPFGQLDRYDTNPATMRFHSPYQITVEFDADLAETSQPWVPLVVTQAARNSANSRLSSQFVNTPGYVVGNPRPF